MLRSPEEIIKRFESLKGERSMWESHWQEIADYMLPRKNDINNWKSPGVKRNLNILDNTGMTSAELLAGALHGMLTNPASLWFELTTGDEAQDKTHVNQLWLQDTVRRMHNRLNNSNFQTEVHEFYLDLVAFNTAGMSIMEDDDYMVRFQAYFLKELFISENSKGRVDEVYRCFMWSARNILQEFGEKNCPKAVMDAINAQKHDEKFEIIHAIYPKDPRGKKVKGLNKPIVSQYVFVKDKLDIRVEGFNEYPWVVARWAKASGEAYGRGPGMNALPEVKMVNLMEETMIRGAQLAIAPPVQMPDDGFTLPLKLKPHGVNFYRSGGNAKDRIEPIFNDTRLDFGEAIMTARRQRIREAFYVDQLQLNQGPQMTATEVVQRTEEKMKFLGPLLGRLQVEFLAPMIDRLFAIMLRKEQFLPPPSGLQGRNLSVRYSSSIAKMQRMGDLKSIQDMLALSAPILQLDSTASQNLDADAFLRGVARIVSLPQEFLRSEDDVETLRQQQQEQAAKQQQLAEDAAEADANSKMGGMAAQVMKAGADVKAVQQEPVE